MMCLDQEQLPHRGPPPCGLDSSGPGPCSSGQGGQPAFGPSGGVMHVVGPVRLIDPYVPRPDDVALLRPIAVMQYDAVIDGIQPVARGRAPIGVLRAPGQFCGSRRPPRICQRPKE